MVRSLPPGRGGVKPPPGGDFTVDDWNQVVRSARQRRTNPTADYLLGTPMLGDYLEESLIQLGRTVEDLEPART